MIKGEVKQAQGVRMSTMDYRSHNALNQSMIKTYLSSPKKFYNEFVLGKKRKDKDSAGILLGSLLDSMLVRHRGNLEEFESAFDEEFVLFDGVKGTGQSFILADYIWQITESETNKDGVIESEFLDRFQRAFDRIQREGKYSKKTMEWALEDFSDSEADAWLQSKILSIGKKVVDISLIDKSKRVYTKVMDDDNVRWVFRGNDDIEQINHFTIEWIYNTLFGDSITCKSELDIVHFHHNTKTVRIFDCKGSFDNENFEYSYLKYRYDLQATFYTMAMRWYLDNTPGLEDYTIEPFSFVVLDTSADEMKPLIYVIGNQDLEKVKHGYSVRGYKYDGLYGALEAINWTLKFGIFDISKEAYENRNVVNLEIRYDNR
jgi:hypothetical protein